jgi:LPS O-antigen subunit length determinant protein (WzzB/FepE family)
MFGFSKITVGLTIALLIVSGIFYGLWQNALSSLDDERVRRVEAETKADQYVTQVKRLVIGVENAEIRLMEQSRADSLRIQQLQNQISEFEKLEDEANEEAEQLEQAERDAGNVQTFDSRGIR